MLPLKLLEFLIMLGRLVCASGSGKRQELVVYQMHKNKKLASPDADNLVTDFKIQTLGTVNCHKLGHWAVALAVEIAIIKRQTWDDPIA